MPLFRPPRSPGASLSRYPVVPFAFCLRLLRLPPCPKTCHFGFPSPGKCTSVPQNRPFWSPEPGKTHLRTPKQVIMGSRALEKAPPCPKTCHFGVPKPEIQRSRWAKQVFLPIRTRKTGLSLGKTDVFTHPRTKNRPFVGQNGHFCPSAAGKQDCRWAKPAFLPISGWARQNQTAGNGEFGLGVCPCAARRVFRASHRGSD